MRLLILAAGAVLTLTACNGNSANDAANTDMNAADLNATTDMNASTDANTTANENAAMTNSLGGLDGNTATNSAAENKLIKKDEKTDDHDTNLGNGI